MAKQKFYVVWKGRKTGIFNSWAECKDAVIGFEGAEYKSYESKSEAEKAFQEGSKRNIHKKDESTSTLKSKKSMPILDSIAVDAAWNTVTGAVEYQGVYTKTKQLLFKSDVFKDGTNNIVEFLAIVHALAYCKKHQINLPIYSDSQTAIGWVKKKKANTKHEENAHNQELFKLLERAEKWLETNSYQNPIYKWQTKDWGEIPADFGRK
ncbi:MAG: ribonuclease H family protein [Flammeovirgaceae bacterium]